MESHEQIIYIGIVRHDGTESPTESKMRFGKIVRPMKRKLFDQREKCYVAVKIFRRGSSRTGRRPISITCEFAVGTIYGNTVKLFLSRWNFWRGGKVGEKLSKFLVVSHRIYLRSVIELVYPGFCIV